MPAAAFPVPDVSASWSLIGAGRNRRPAPGADQLTVLYDATCMFCRRCRSWLESQPTFVPLRFLACQSPEATARYGGLPWLAAELVVINEDGEAWIGPAAFLVCLWATRRYREWSVRLAEPTLAGMTERFFHAISSHRTGLAKVLELGRRHECTDGTCTTTYRHDRAVPFEGVRVEPATGVGARSRARLVVESPPERRNAQASPPSFGVHR